MTSNLRHSANSGNENADSTKPKTLREWAAYYAERGWAVCPCGPRTKIPLTEHGFKDATTTTATIAAWWTRWPNANIAVATGTTSGVWVIDIDCKEDVNKTTGEITMLDGFAAFDALTAQHGPLPSSYIAQSGSGGKHYFFTMPTDGTEIRSSASKIGPGIDVRASGGYVILSPSIHPNGKAYRWIDGSRLDAAPGWLVELVTSKPKPKRSTAPPTPPAAPESPRRISARNAAYLAEAFRRELAAIRAAPEGTRNDALNKAVFAMAQFIPNGWLSRSEVETAATAAALDAGLEEDETRRTIASAITAGVAQPRDPPNDPPSPLNGHSPHDGIATPPNGHASHDELRAAERAPAPALAQAVTPPPRRRFPLVPFAQLRMSTSARYLVKNIIPSEGIVVVWGPPKCGKTFWTFDIIAHIALGWDYRGHRVRQGTVVYVGLEGTRGIEARVEAFRRTHLAEDAGHVPLHLLLTRLDLVAEAALLIDEIRDQLPDEHTTVIVIDTLNRSLAGSESSDEDMSAYVRAADAVREAFGCAVIIIHHCGHDDGRPRGHTALLGALDAQIAVAQEKATGIITTTVERMKDGEEGAIVSSKLSVIEVGTDEDGEPVTSCVIVPTDEHAAPPRRQITGQARLALDQLNNAMVEEGSLSPQSPVFPNGQTTVVRLGSWKDRCERAKIVEADIDGESTKRAFRRVRRRLQEDDFIGVWGEYVWIVGDRRTSRTMGGQSPDNPGG